MAFGRLPAMLAAAAIAATACGGPRASREAEPEPPGQPEPLVDAGELIDVLPPDQIPAIDKPRFVPPAQTTAWLADREPVIALELGGETRAYPAQIMTWHEIVNDVVGGVPVTVTYCPLCNSAIAFDRRVASRVLDFGTSGKLYQSALVMYDRQTESLWTHFDGLAIRGPLAGTTLRQIPVQMVSFGTWRREFPGGRVLSRETGHQRSYGENPYPYYERADGPRDYFFRGSVDGRLGAAARVLGVSTPDGDVAVPYAELRVERVIHHRIGSLELVAFWVPGTSSALDTPRIAEGIDVGATGVFVPRVGARTLTFAVAGDRIVDRETESSWSVTGRAVSGPLRGARLEAILHVDTFWFAWQAYKADTAVYGIEA